MTLGVILGYLVLVLAVGVLSHRLFRGTGEDYFLATRTIGPFVLLMSLFGTHMTSFSLLGASGEAYRTGVGVFSLMASSSAIVVPMVFYVVGIRLWSLGKRHGYVTQVEFFRDRWGSEAVALSLFVALVLLVIPYLLIGVLGAGQTLGQMTEGSVPAWLGSLLVCAVVLVYVTYGGLRGTAWANTFQTLVFMSLGALTFVWVLREVGGLQAALDRVEAARPQALMLGEAVPPWKFVTYAFLPLSVGMFPHMFMHWLTARRAESFKLPMVAYPICIAIVWIPSVLLGVIGTSEVPGLEGPTANSILVRMIDLHAPALLAGLLAAGVFAAIMSSLDSQVLSLGTMFTRDIVGRFGRKQDSAAQVRTGRWFVVGILTTTFLLSLVSPPSIFKLGVWSFTGFSALFPIVLAALFWRRSTAGGVLAAIFSVAAGWIYFFLQDQATPKYTVGGTGIMPVAVLFVVSSAALIVGSLLTAPPSDDRLARFFPGRT